MSFSLDDKSLVHFGNDDNQLDEFEDVEFLEPENDLKPNEQNFEGDTLCWNSIKTEIEPDYLNIIEEQEFDEVESVKRYFTIIKYYLVVRNKLVYICYGIPF